MAVEIFTRTDFEAALPVHKCTQRPLWTYNGLDAGEHTYTVKPFPARPYAIYVRSSIHGRPGGSDSKAGTDRSAESGQDSIRAWIITESNKPFGSKISRYVTRVTGWQDRLTDTLRRLSRIITLIEDCPNCGSQCPIFKCSKEGANKGKLFSKCTNSECTKKHFKWIEE